MKDYTIVCFWSEEDQAWVADIPDLKYCSAFGPTPSQAVAEVLEAKEAWLEAARETGRTIPEPQYQPLRYATG